MYASVRRRVGMFKARLRMLTEADGRWRVFLKLGETMADDSFDFSSVDHSIAIG